jgi:hypothetical protein
MFLFYFQKKIFYLYHLLQKHLKIRALHNISLTTYSNKGNISLKMYYEYL